LFLSVEEDQWCHQCRRVSQKQRGMPNSQSDTRQYRRKHRTEKETYQGNTLQLRIPRNVSNACEVTVSGIVHQRHRTNYRNQAITWVRGKVRGVRESWFKDGGQYAQHTHRGLRIVSTCSSNAGDMKQGWGSVQIGALPYPSRGRVEKSILRTVGNTKVKHTIEDPQHQPQRGGLYHHGDGRELPMEIARRGQGLIPGSPGDQSAGTGLRL